MSSITLKSRQKNRKLPQIEVPVIADNDELRRFSESIKEHLRMYEGDSGAPKERFVTIEELELSGIVTTKVQQGFASIDKVFGQQIAAIPSTIPTAGAPGATGAAGATTLRGLDDTAVEGIDGGQGIVFNGSKYVPKEFPDFKASDASRYDMLYFDGEDWVDTKQELQWNPTDDYLQLANEHSINWLDTAGVTRDFVNFAEFGVGGGDQAVGHIIVKLDAGVTTTSSSFNDVTGAKVAYSAMEANTDYAVFVRAYTGNSTSTVTPLNGMRLTKGGVLVTGSDMFYESPGVTIDLIGLVYAWGGIIASGGSGDLQLQHLSGNGSDTIFTNDVVILMIKVDDLVLGTNIFHDTDSGLVELDDGDFPPVWFNTGAGVTVVDSGDYLVFGTMQLDDYTTGGNTVETRVNDGSSTQIGQKIARMDASDKIPLGFMQLWKSVDASTTFTLEARGQGFPVDKVWASIIAIRIDAFVDYHSVFLATSPDLGDGPRTLATVAFTTSSAEDYGFLACGTGGGSGSTGAEHFIRNDLNGVGDSTIGGSEVQLDIQETGGQTIHYAVSADQALGAGDTVDADFVAADATTPLIWFNNFMVVFQWAVGEVTKQFFDTGNVGYTTRMKGLTTRFYDPGLTDYVEFDHDDTDFNITGFQTADLNLTGFTALNAGTVDADFDALTATSYETILAANLLSRTVNESITGDWTFDDATLSIAGATADNEVTFAHDDTDLNITGLNTTDINITGITALNAGAMDADFDAITGTSYGGIAEANLLDKSASAVVSGDWTFSGNLISSGYLHIRTTTTAALNAVANAINTDAGKIRGAVVYNTDTDNPVYAVGSADADIWVDGAGTTAHSPA